MSKCSDCLSEEICRYNDGHNLYCKDEYVCPHFKDRSGWLNLPCKLGDTVYYFDGAYYLKDKNMWEIKPIKVTEFSTKIGRSGKLYPLSIIANGTRYPLTSIGKTVFLTREEAGKALEGMKGNG